MVTPVMTGQREFGFINIISLLIAQPGPSTHTRGDRRGRLPPRLGEPGTDIFCAHHRTAPGDSPRNSAKDLTADVAGQQRENMATTS